MIKKRIACFGITKKIDQRNAINRRLGQRAHDKVEICGGEPRPTIGPDHREPIMSNEDASDKLRQKVAEGVGFEPTVGCPTLDFESSALNRTQPPFLRVESVQPDWRQRPTSNLQCKIDFEIGARRSAFDGPFRLSGSKPLPIRKMSQFWA